MRGGVELANGDILLAAVGRAVTIGRCSSCARSDAGETWSAPKLVAAGEGHEFEEPATLVLRSGRIVMLLRDNATRILHSVISDDDGATWSQPRPTGIEGYPAAHARPRRRTDRRRRRPGDGRRSGFIVHFSDDGERWGPPIALIDDLPNKDLGYPAMAQRENGDLFVVYYAQDRDGVTGIDSVTARLP